MPSGDRTGPRGLGSMTGRSLGYCAGYDTPGYTRGPGMGGAWRRGRGGGFSRGMGYGRHWQWDYRIPSYTFYRTPILPKITPEDQLDMFKQQKEFLESEMNNIKSAVEEISKKIIELEKES
ncbi:MAG: DUF5320 domain-containing protein [Promethearchaeota archaeon]